MNIYTLNIKRTDSNHPSFLSLNQKLNIELADRDGDEHSFYAQYNKTDSINHVIVGFVNSIPVACGAIKPYSKNVIEIKRMYVFPTYRGRGYAKQILKALESWAIELKFKKCMLETGLKQPEAIGLYKRTGYSLIFNYGPYIGVENSLCFEKLLIPKI